MESGSEFLAAGNPGVLVLPLEKVMSDDSHSEGEDDDDVINEEDVEEGSLRRLALVSTANNTNTADRTTSVSTDTNTTTSLSTPSLSSLSSSASRISSTTTPPRDTHNTTLPAFPPPDERGFQFLDLTAQQPQNHNPTATTTTIAPTLRFSSIPSCPPYICSPDIDPLNAKRVLITSRIGKLSFVVSCHETLKESLESAHYGSRHAFLELDFYSDTSDDLYKALAFPHRGRRYYGQCNVTGCVPKSNPSDDPVQVKTKKAFFLEDTNMHVVRREGHYIIEFTKFKMDTPYNPNNGFNQQVGVASGRFAICVSPSVAPPKSAGNDAKACPAVWATGCFEDAPIAYPYSPVWFRDWRRDVEDRYTEKQEQEAFVLEWQVEKNLFEKQKTDELDVDEEFPDPGPCFRSRHFIGFDDIPAGRFFGARGNPQELFELPDLFVVTSAHGGYKLIMVEDNFESSHKAFWWENGNYATFELRPATFGEPKKGLKYEVKGRCNSGATYVLDRRTIPTKFTFLLEITDWECPVTLNEYPEAVRTAWSSGATPTEMVQVGRISGRVAMCYFHHKSIWESKKSNYTPWFAGTFTDKPIYALQQPSTFGADVVQLTKEASLLQMSVEQLKKEKLSEYKRYMTIVDWRTTYWDSLDIKDEKLRPRLGPRQPNFVLTNDPSNKSKLGLTSSYTSDLFGAFSSDLSAPPRLGRHHNSPPKRASPIHFDGFGDSLDSSLNSPSSSSSSLAHPHDFDDFDQELQDALFNHNLDTLPLSSRDSGLPNLPNDTSTTPAGTAGGGGRRSPVRRTKNATKRASRSKPTTDSKGDEYEAGIVTKIVMLGLATLTGALVYGLYSKRRNGGRGRRNQR